MTYSVTLPIFNPLYIVTMLILYVNEQSLFEKFPFICQKKKNRLLTVSGLL